MTNVTIVLGLNGSGTSVLAGNESNLTEVATWGEDLDESIISVFISNCDFAFTFGDEVKVGCELTLSNDQFLWVIHEQLHLREEDVNQLLIILKHTVILDDILEDEFDNLMFQTCRNVLDEKCQFFLILLTLLSELEETDDTRLKIKRKFDVLHSGVDLIKLLLESILFSVEILNQHSHITQDVSVDNGTDCITKHNKEHLNITHWECIITSHIPFFALGLTLEPKRSRDAAGRAILATTNVKHKSSKSN